MSDENNEYFILTSIGIEPQETRYRLEKNIGEGSFSASALINLLDNKPSKVLLLLTDGAKDKSFEKFKQEIDAQDVKIEIETISIPDGENGEEIEKIVNTILKSVPDDCDLTIDITQGLRHFPFLLFTSALYLQTFKNIHIKNIYYGMKESSTDEKPFVDITLLLRMVDWFHAVRSFSEERRASQFVKMVKSFSDKMDKDNRLAQEAVKLVDKIDLFDEYYGTGMPLGLGDSSKSFCMQFAGKKDTVFGRGKDTPIPLARELLDHVANSLEPLMIPRTVRTGGNWKTTYPLDMKEIYRQAGLVDDYFKSGHYVNAVRLMREWMISRCILARLGDGASWLNRDSRSPIERQLGSINWQKRNDILQDDKKDLAALWDSIAKSRNNVAHTEMTEENVDIKSEINKIRGLWSDMKCRIESDDFWDPYTGGGGGKLLITPLGLSKGLLFSALRLTQPDRLLIVTSTDAAETIEEIVEVAGYEGQMLKPILLKDPHTGFDEIKGVLDDLINDYARAFLDSDEIIINLTGGTTTLQVLTEGISKNAQMMGKDPRKVVIIDRREMSQQKENPFVVGELIEYEDIFSSNGKR